MQHLRGWDDLDRLHEAAAAEITRLRTALREAAGHLLDAGNALQDTARADGARCCRMAAERAMRQVEGGDG